MFLYVIESLEPTRSVLKIGITNDLEKRIKNIQTGNPYPVRYVFFQERNDAADLEKWLFTQFSIYRLEGEWFHTITLQEIRKKIFDFNDICF